MSGLVGLLRLVSGRLGGALALAGLALLTVATPWSSATPLAHADSVLTVNSAADDVTADESLTLREAICLATTGQIGTLPDCSGSPRIPTVDEVNQVNGPPGPGESDLIIFKNSFTIQVDCFNLERLPDLSDVNGGFGDADTIDGSGHTIKIQPGQDCENVPGLATTPTSDSNTIRGIQVLRRGGERFLLGVALFGTGNRLEAGDKNTACHIQGPGGNASTPGAAVIIVGTVLSVDDCEIDGGPVGVLVESSQNFSITNNHIHDNEFGVVVVVSTGGGIASNLIEKNDDHGVAIFETDPGDRILVGSNTIRENDVGVATGGALIFVENNSFKRNKRLAIDLNHDESSEIFVSCGNGDGQEPDEIAGVEGVRCPRITSADPATKTLKGTADHDSCPANDGCLVEVYLAFDDGDNTGGTTKPHGEGFQPLGFAPVDSDGNWSLVLPNPFAKGDAFTALAFNPDRGLTSEFSPNLVVPGTNLAVTAGNSSATVSFSPPAASQECPIQSYQLNVYRGSQLVKSVNTSHSPVLVTGLQNGQAYTFTLIAVYCNGDGPESARSAPVTPGVATAIPDGVFLTKASGGSPLSFGGDNLYDTSGGGGGGTNVASGDGPRIVGSASIPFRIQNDGGRADRIKVRAIESSRSLAGITITVNGLKVNDGTTPELAANGGKLDGNIVVKVASNAAKGNYVVRITLQANGAADPAQSDSVTLRFRV